jgi:hypothetical protein
MAMKATDFKELLTAIAHHKRGTALALLEETPRLRSLPWPGATSSSSPNV